MQEIRPQPGFQERFLSCNADIVIGGGAAGCGKSFALCLDALRWVDYPGYLAVLFRRNISDAINPGGLWDEMMGMYPLFGGRPIQSPKHKFVWRPKKRGFRGAAIAIGHLQYEKTVLDWQGPSVPLIAFDELTHFSESQFFYMLSRNRSVCGIRPYIRATCNPDPDSWVRKFVDWWIGEDGYADPARAGKVRWFVRVNDALLWADRREDLSLYAKSGMTPKSVAFIPGSLSDNRILEERDPGYRANLEALDRVNRERLLEGNWNIRPSAGMYFPRDRIFVLPACPTDVVAWARGWDLAASEASAERPSPDRTAGVRIGRRENGRFVIADCRAMAARAHDVREAIRATASQDGVATRIHLPQDPGQAGLDQVQSLIRYLNGFVVRSRRMTGDKWCSRRNITRAEPFAAQWQAGNVDIVAGPWNDEFLRECDAFGDGKSHDDIVDAMVEAHHGLLGGGGAVVSSGGPRRVDNRIISRY